MYHVYIIENSKGRRYVGVTSNIDERLNKHNHSGTKWTKYKGPWRIVYEEKINNRVDAMRRERKIKSYKGGNAFKKLIDS